ncbi:hypothetical protein [Flammeovirga aprica]|uniref:Uncharacterized protein n=1 Tax=Flammeovirga aprica JL-4 TaxID=694437 RepID=A0A7X9XCS7_9BACT|nr:hypothetical protein [Flammeovirga aprica]NME72117.1 hypothetical protein [Flammeovirga aprica JL-4]
MENAIKNRIPIHVDLEPNRDEVYSGICLKENNEVFIFICFNDEKKEYDGYAILRSQEIEKYRYWDNEELSDIKNNNYKDFLNKLPLGEMNSFQDCLVKLKEKELIAIFTSDDNDSYYVGNIKNIIDKKVTLRLLSESSEWLDDIEIVIDEITYIGFDTSYEKELIKPHRQ